MGGDQDHDHEEPPKNISSHVLLIDLGSSGGGQAHHKSSDNLSLRCESPLLMIEPPPPPQQALERKCSVYRAEGPERPEQKYYYYDDESKLNENDTYYDNYSRTIRYELDPNGVHRVVADNGEPCSYDLMVPTTADGGNSWISPDYLCEMATKGRKHSTGICTCDHVEVTIQLGLWCSVCMIVSSSAGDY